MRHYVVSLLLYIVSIIGIGACLLSLPFPASAQIDIERNISVDPRATRTTAEENVGFFSDENLLIVEIFLERNGTGENIEVFQHEGGFFVPLGYLSRLLEFPIKIDADNGEAEGWFIRENRIFDLNLARSEVIVEGVKSSFDPVMAQLYYGDIYVDQALFSKWFPIDLELKFSDLVVRLMPREKLPVQERIEREKNRDRIGYLSREKVPFGDRIENPYRAYSEPFLGVDIGYEYASNIETANGHNTPYSVRMVNDLGYTNMQFFLSGGIRDGVQGLRSSFSRKNYDGGMLKPLNISEIKFGDINAVAIPMVSQSSQGRGVVISNQEIERSSKFDSRDFIGDAVPGWDVELYRNGVLLDSLVVPQTGRYEFLDIPVLFGNNSFRLVFYGPQGEIREEVENYLIDDSFAGEGEFFYDFAVDQKSKSLFGVEERNRVTLHEQDMRTTASMLYGLTKRTTLTGGFVSSPINDGTRHNYMQTGVRHSLGGVLTNVNTAYDMKNEGSILQMILATSIDDISIKAEQQFLDDFVSEVQSPTSRRRERLSSLNVNGALQIGLPLNYSVTGEYEVFEGSDNTSTSLSNRLSTTIKGLFVSNQLSWNENESNGVTNHLTTGNFSVRGRFMETLVRPSISYELAPESELQNVSLSLQRNLTRTLNIRTDMRKDLQGTGVTSFSAALTKDFESYRLGANMQADDEGEYTFGMNLSFSFGREPRSGAAYFSRRDITNSGAVSARAFLDKNLNQKFDADDELLPGVGFRMDNRGYEGTAGESVVFIPYLPQDRSVNVQVDQVTIDDPFWIAKPEGYSVIARPGVTQVIDFPVAITTEIDGEVSLRNGSNVRRLAGVTIELVNQKNGEVVQTQRSEFDGFYLFQKVTAGEYYLRISQEDLAYYDAIEDYRIDLSIPQGSDIVSHQNLFVVQARENAEEAEEVDGVNSQDETVTPEITSDSDMTSSP